MLLFTLLYTATAHSFTTPNQLITQATGQKLASHPYWLALLHYPKKISIWSKTHSEIISDSFFLSPQGKFDPEAELIATLKAFFSSTTEPDHPPRCRFIARYHWLKKQLNWSSTAPLHCPKFNQFNQQGKISSVSLIFATGYLSNPASFYGHVLLKFNNEKQKSYSSGLLDQSLNYGAIVPQGENGLIYVLKGLLGGYNASFSHDVFYRQNHLYIENELRDLWEYRLNLTPEQKNRLIYHSWELLETQFQYYFLNKNCAYAMADLLELIVDAPLKSNSAIWALPSDLFNNLMTNKKSASPLVNEILYRPSRQSQFYQRFHNLTTPQQNQLISIVKDPTFSLTQLAHLQQNEQIKISDTLLDYYAFRLLTDDDKESAKQKKQQLLIHRINLKRTNIENNTTVVSPPTNGPLPLMLRFGLQQQESHTTALQFTTRLSYYDLLNLEAGRLPNTQLTTLELKLSLEDSTLHFKRLDFFHIQNLNVSQSNLPKDGGWAWKVRFFADQQRDDCSLCPKLNLKLGAGKALQLTQNLIAYLMNDVTLSSHKNSAESVRFTPYAALLASITPHWKSHLQLRQNYDLKGEKVTSTQWQWQNRFGNSRDWDLRLNYQQQNKNKSITSAISLYW